METNETGLGSESLTVRLSNMEQTIEYRTKKAVKVTWTGFFGNLFLTAAKLVAGFLGNSTAMIADGIHSLSDFATDIVVIGFVHVSGKESDAGHHYGHGKYETFATFLISTALLLVGAGIFWSGFRKMMRFFQGEALGLPSWIALAAALVSLLVKELLFRYTVIVGRRINNQAVIANGWHHRSDALSSIASALGISGAMLLGPSWSVLDPLAGMVVSFFIFRVALQLGLPSINELLEASLPKGTEKEINDIIRETEGVRSHHRLKTRKIGSIIAIDVHIHLDRDISFVRSHDIATALEIRLREKYGSKTQISIHTEPERELKE